MTALGQQAGAERQAQPDAASRGKPLPPDRPVAGIVFDVPDVFYDATLWRRWLFQLLGRLGIRLPYGEFHRAWDARLVDVHRGRREYAETLESFLLDCGLSWAQVDEIEAAGRIARRKLELAVRPLPGVSRATSVLARSGLLLAAWADAPYPGAVLGDRLRCLLPDTRFDAIITSFDLECTQPAPACHRAMLCALGLSASQSLYVGHDADHLAGARTAGLRTIGFNHGSEAEADHYLTRFDDLPALVQSLVASSAAGQAAGRLVA